MSKENHQLRSSLNILEADHRASLAFSCELQHGSKERESKPKVEPTPEQVEEMGEAMSAASLYALYKQAIDRFRASVLVNPATAYRDLVYEIKEASASFVSDVKGADLDRVITSISSLTAAHFTTDMEMEQEDKDKDPEIDLTDLSLWSPNVQKAIMELQQV